MSNFYEGNYGYSAGRNDQYNQYNGSSSTGQQQQHYSQQYSQPPQQQQQQQQPPQQFWNPTTAMSAAAAFTSSDSNAMYNVAESMGKQFLETGWAKAVPGLERSMLALRPYFAVDNSFVKKKMARILFPFVSKDWARTKLDPNMVPPSYMPPHQDVNAPDLYIPTMSLLTYVLLCALCYGTANKFNPEVIPDVITKCLVTQLLEVFAIRIGFYAMEAQVALLDLLSYTGYKYLGLSVNMLSGISLGQYGGYGHKAYYFTYLWTASSISFFILKVMANVIPVVTSSVGPKRHLMVLGFAMSQFATCWWVSQTKFLN
ncbi:hypothetical protein ACHAXN_011317 [Cyclotella atomus]|jgi:hypothetical protein